MPNDVAKWAKFTAREVMCSAARVTQIIFDEDNEPHEVQLALPDGSIVSYENATNALFGLDEVMVDWWIVHYLHTEPNEEFFELLGPDEFEAQFAPAVANPYIVGADIPDGTTVAAVVVGHFKVNGGVATFTPDPDYQYSIVRDGQTGVPTYASMRKDET